MKKIKLTQNQYALVDNEDFEYLNQWKWFFSSGYARRDVKSNGVRTRVYMHAVVNQTAIGLQTDHINHNSLDNRKINLRTVTVRENQLNRKDKQTNNVSGYTGVHWATSRHKWVAQIKIRNKRKFLGHFDNIQDAVKARGSAEEVMKYYE